MSAAVARSLRPKTAVKVTRRCSVTPLRAVASATTSSAEASSPAPSSSPAVLSTNTKLRQFTRLKVLPRLAACVEMEEAVLRFENVAGRSAMIGFLTALVAEIIADQGLFSNFTVAGLPGVATFISAGVAIGTALAFGTREELGRAVEEAVITSLTAVKRSAASVSQTQLDEYVDIFFDKLPIFDIDLSSASYDDSDEEDVSK